METMKPSHEVVEMARQSSQPPRMVAVPELLFVHLMDYLKRHARNDEARSLHHQLGQCLLVTVRKP